MELADVFYEAACRMSNIRSKQGDFSCCVVDSVGGVWSMDEYDKIMRNRRGEFYTDLVEQAAKEVHWSLRDYRTFMLLMASEAVRR